MPEKTLPPERTHAPRLKVTLLTVRVSSVKCPPSGRSQWQLRVDCACSSHSGADASVAPQVCHRHGFPPTTAQGSGVRWRAKISTVCSTLHPVVASVGFRERGRHVMADCRSRLSHSQRPQPRRSGRPVSSGIVCQVDSRPGHFISRPSIVLADARRYWWRSWFHTSPFPGASTARVLPRSNPPTGCDGKCRGTGSG